MQSFLTHREKPPPINTLPVWLINYSKHPQGPPQLTLQGPLPGPAQPLCTGRQDSRQRPSSRPPGPQRPHVLGHLIPPAQNQSRRTENRHAHHKQANSLQLPHPQWLKKTHLHGFSRSLLSFLPRGRHQLWYTGVPSSRNFYLGFKSVLQEEKTEEAFQTDSAQHPKA